MIKKKILVTGGAGFLGSHLCEKLLNLGHEVVCLDNYFTGQKRNIVHLLDNPYFELIRHDVIMPFFIEVDEIYNLACPASPVHYQYNAIKTVKTSVMGAINMLGLANAATPLGLRAMPPSNAAIAGFFGAPPVTGAGARGIPFSTTGTLGVGLSYASGNSAYGIELYGQHDAFSNVATQGGTGSFGSGATTRRRPSDTLPTGGSGGSGAEAGPGVAPDASERVVSQLV